MKEHGLDHQILNYQVLLTLTLEGVEGKFRMS